MEPKIRTSVRHVAIFSLEARGRVNKKILTLNKDQEIQAITENNA